MPLYFFKYIHTFFFVWKKLWVDKHVDLLLTGEKCKIHFVLSRDFNIFTYDYAQHLGKNIFIVKDCFKINGKQRIKKKDEYVKSKNYEQK